MKNITFEMLGSEVMAGGMEHLPRFESLDILIYLKHLKHLKRFLDILNTSSSKVFRCDLQTFGSQ